MCDCPDSLPYKYLTDEDVLEVTCPKCGTEFTIVREESFDEYGQSSNFHYYVRKALVYLER